MKRRVGLILIVLLAVAGTAAWLVRPTETPVAANEPPLAVPAEALDFGDIWETPAHEFTIPVENRSATAVEVTGWGRSCSCLAVEPERLTLGPGESHTVRIRLDLTTQAADGPPESARPFETYLIALSGKEPVSPKWMLRGRVRSVFGSLPRQLECEPVSDLADQASPTVLDLTPALPLRSVSATIEPAWASAAVQPIEGTNRLRVTIQPKLPVAVGEWSATLRLVATSATGEALPPRELRVLIRGRTDVQADPPRLLLGTLGEGETTTTEVAFRSLTGRSFEVEPAQPTAPGITVERQEGSPTVFRVSVRGASGSQLVPVEFRVRQPNRAEYTVRVEAAYHGMPR